MKQVLVLLLFLAVILLVNSCEKARTAPAFITKETVTDSISKKCSVHPFKLFYKNDTKGKSEGAIFAKRQNTS
jgi:hypothetical protein